MNKNPRKSEAVSRLEPDRLITVVSGLPRSGTSMMMQMLVAAGLEAASDARRIQDDDNPHGYFELEAVKRIRQDASFLDGVVGKALKVVAPLLPSLPNKFDYAVVFLERDLSEVLASQSSMLSRGTKKEAPTPAPDEALREAFANQVSGVKDWLAKQGNIRTLFVSHRATIESPRATSEVVADFLASCGAPGVSPDAATLDAMSRAVDPRLYRRASNRE